MASRLAVARPSRTIPFRHGRPPQPDQALHLYHQGEPHLRPGAGRHAARATATRRYASFPSRSRPTSTPSPGSSCCLDNFYVDGEVSANGPRVEHGGLRQRLRGEGLAAGLPPVQRAQQRSGPRLSRIRPRVKRPSAAQPAATSGTAAATAGVAYRELWRVHRKRREARRTRPRADEGPGRPLRSALPRLRPDYSDQLRADRFIAELHRFEREGSMPGLVIVRLPNDHTSGTSPGKPTPRAYVADNDLALGRIVEAVSHGKFWKETAIFVLEDDAQNGPDHVDAHRSIAFVISPYTKRQLRRFQHVFHVEHVADDGADFGVEADDAVRRRRAADVRLVPGQSRRRRRIRTCPPTWTSTSETTPRPTARADPADGLYRGRRGRRAAIERDHLALCPRP